MYCILLLTVFVLATWDTESMEQPRKLALEFTCKRLVLLIYKGCSINKLQNGIIVLP